MSFDTTLQTECMCSATRLGAIRDLLGTTRRQMSEVMKSTPHRISQIDFTDPNHLIVGTVDSYLKALGLRMVFRFRKPGDGQESDYVIDPDTTYPNGRNINALAELRDTTQAAMGRRCGMHQTRVSHIEHSDIRRLKMHTVRRYADACGRDVSAVGWDPSAGVEVELLI